MVELTRIAVIGSINMDIVNVVGKHPALGETVQSRETAYSPGGKGANQAVAASLAGGRVTMLGAVGNDFIGEELLEALKKNGIDTTHIQKIEGTSGLAFITVDANGENTIILSAGSNAKVGRGHVEAFLDRLEGTDILLLQNEIPLDTTLYVVEKAHETGVKVYLNPAPAAKIPERYFARIDVLAVNAAEAQELCGRPVDGFKAAAEAARSLIAGGIRGVLVTLGAKGSIYVDGQAEVAVPAFRVQAVDTTAAGDTFIGAFAVARGSGQSVEESMKFASAAAAIAVTRKGAQRSIPRAHEISLFLKQHPPVRFAGGERGLNSDERVR